MVTQISAPERMSLSETSAFLGPDLALLEFLICDAVLDAHEEHLTSKESLRGYLDTALEMAQGL